MRRLLVVLAVGVLLAAASLAPATAAGKKPRVFSPRSEPYGLSYGEWQARWFKWFIEVPAPINPAADETGEFCGVGQRGPVWFLSAFFSLEVTRNCTIPAGKAVYVLAGGNECSNIEPPPFFGSNEAELRACAAAGFEEFLPTPPSVTVDGVAIRRISRFRTQTPVFSYTLPADNLYGLPAGTTATMAVSDGIAVMLKPLRPGRHQVVISLESPFLPARATLTYNLTVLPEEDDDDDRDEDDDDD